MHLPSLLGFICAKAGYWRQKVLRRSVTVHVHKVDRSMVPTTKTSTTDQIKTKRNACQSVCVFYEEEKNETINQLHSNSIASYFHWSTKRVADRVLYTWVPKNRHYRAGRHMKEWLPTVPHTNPALYFNVMRTRTGKCICALCGNWMKHSNCGYKIHGVRAGQTRNKAFVHVDYARQLITLSLKTSYEKVCGLRGYTFLKQNQSSAWKKMWTHNDVRRPRRTDHEASDWYLRSHWCIRKSIRSDVQRAYNKLYWMFLFRLTRRSTNSSLTRWDCVIFLKQR